MRREKFIRKKLKLQRGVDAWEEEEFHNINRIFFFGKLIFFFFLSVIFPFSEREKFKKIKKS